jgi:hypothetical protein
LTANRVQRRSRTYYADAELGYAVTNHTAQGRTAHTAHTVHTGGYTLRGTDRWWGRYGYRASTVVVRCPVAMS